MLLINLQNLKHLFQVENATKMNMTKIAIFFILIIVILNIPPAKWIAGPDDILYSNANGSFTFDESNVAGRNYNLCIENFKVFKSVNNIDTVLFRITPINLFKIWRWGDYMTNEKYKLKYKPWKQIETARGHLKNKTAWQSF